MIIDKKKIFYLLLIIPLISCNVKTTNKDISGFFSIDDLQIRKGKRLNANDWHCLNIENDRVCCPIKWYQINQNKCLFFTQLDDKNNNTFFAVVRYNKDSIRISLKNYAEEVYRQLKSDSVEILEEFTFRELVFDKKKAFYGEFITEIDNNRYLTFTMYTDYKGYLYDLSLKIPYQEREKYYEIFQDILYNYKTNDKFIFSEKDELNSFQEIDLSKF